MRSLSVFFSIWKSLGRPQDGDVLECYTDLQRTFSRAFRSVMNSRAHKQLQLLEDLYAARRPGQFWNSIRKTRIHTTNYDAISIDTLNEYFKGKFSALEENRGDALDDSAFVHQKMMTLSANPMNSIMLEERRIIRLIN